MSKSNKILMVKSLELFLVRDSSDRPLRNPNAKWDIELLNRVSKKYAHIVIFKDLDRSSLPIWPNTDVKRLIGKIPNMPFH